MTEAADWIVPIALIATFLVSSHLAFYYVGKSEGLKLATRMFKKEFPDEEK